MKALNEDIDMVRRGATGIIAGAVLTGIMIGGLVGMVIALLYAPSSGEETRARMRGTAIELRDRATETIKDTVSQTKSKAQELKENALDKAADMKQRAKTIADVKLG
jgi:gas vesicle protein